VTTLRIPPAEARSFELKAGSRVTVTDPEGSQVGDLLCFALPDVRERFSQARTRVYLESLRIHPGDPLFSNRNRRMLTLLEDTVGVHDLLFCGCSAFVYRQLLGAGTRPGCLDTLAAALAPFGVAPEDVEAPFNLFMATTVGEEGRLDIVRSPSRPGDHVVFRAEMDLVVGLAACADDVTACNGGVCSPLDVEIHGAGRPSRA
jgi:uncharacterized protein YcgI (DUF1989 family)